MPRKQFVTDLQNACGGVSIAGISEVKQGDDDGMFTFMCLVHGQQLQISALITDVSEYPSSHMYMIFAPDHAPAPVATALSAIADDAFGKPILQLMELVSRKLDSTDTDGDQQMLDSQDYDELEEEDSDEEVDDFYLEDEPVQAKYTPSHKTSTNIEGYAKPTSEFRARIRADLLHAKVNGFKVGHLGGLMDGIGCFVSLSCRISKLGISQEAMQAWQVEPSEYLVVIFNYPSGYKNMDSLKGYDIPTARRNFEMRIGISTTYKPTIQEAVDAFTTLNKEKEQRRDEDFQSEVQTLHKGFRNSFISRPLNDLLAERFPQLLRYRYNGMPWNGAEQFYHDHIGSNNHADLGLGDQYIEPEYVSTTYPSLVTADHIQEAMDQNHSLPLVGMQFVLRHFVRCCEFCLICFAKMPDDLQAIKPYVCDKPLCLYQYMSLGFGPSIEHEILSQPMVVDLLVSFCYTSARTGKLKNFPTGLSLMVPHSSAYGSDYLYSQQSSGYYGYGTGADPAAPAAASTSKQATTVPIKYNDAMKEILFEDKSVKCPVRTGDWIIIRTTDNSGKALHCRVSDTSLYPTVSVAEPVTPASVDSTRSNQGYAPAKPVPNRSAAPAVPATPSSDFKPAHFHHYDQNFDELDEHGKREAIYALLDLLPSVSDMKQYLTRKQQSALSSWVDRFPPAALALLRWIIASNRACIMQVDEDVATVGRKGQDRLCGMPGWSQFRFAMGAPDKERRFITSVRETTDRLKLTYPTLFAWHGSPLHNWHSIIREGLHFKDTAHGRAYGHGVYHSLDCNTSLGYSGSYHGSTSYWPVSELKVSQALALNEIVNAPGEFVSSNPHLVVAQLDWIQTRYLFIKTGSDFSQAATASAETQPFDPIEQDLKFTPRGTGGNIVIPKSAIPGSRRPASRSYSKIKHKRQKTSGSTGTIGTFLNPIDIDADDDDGMSVATLEEDLVCILNIVHGFT
jgi:ubiquitin-conjugating enzyme E2 Q